MRIIITNIVDNDYNGVEGEYQYVKIKSKYYTLQLITFIFRTLRSKVR